MRALALALAGVAACIPDTHYQPSGPSLDLYYVDGVAIDLNEGQTGAVQAYLSGTPPDHDITIDFHTDDPTRLQLTTNSFVFPAAQYSQPQLVNLFAPHDADAVDNVVHLIGEGDGVASGTLDVTVQDVDTMTIVPSVAALDIDEGTSMSFGVTLSAQPTSTVTVMIQTMTPDEVQPTMLTFDASDYTTPQLVMVTSDHDTNTISEDEAVSLMANAIPTAIVTVHNHDTGP